ncbi:MAG: sortase [Lachnospiraceae bacterium]
MKKKLGISLIIVGTVLLAAALSLVLYNKFQDYRYGKAAGDVLTGLVEVIPGLGEKGENSNPGKTETTPMPDKSQNGIVNEYLPDVEQETTVEYDGITYLGIISIPTMDIELPVTASWDYDLMKFAACRYTGSVLSGDLVICAHNLNSFFSGIGNLNSGDSIIFIDAKGKYHYYEVLEISTVGGYDTQQMKEGSDSWDITLFTCTYGGANRVTVRAVAVE